MIRVAALGSSMVMRCALGALAAAATSACYRERERLVPPVVELEVDNTSIVAGGTVVGRARATDASGLTSLAIAAWTPDSSFQAPTQHYIHAESVEVAFSLHVSSAAMPGTLLAIEVTVSDNQSFTVKTGDTLALGARRSALGARRLP